MSALTNARQAVLATEHQAVFAYGLLGPKLSGAEFDQAVADAAAHAAVRDATRQSLARDGLTPVGPNADYPRLYPVTDDRTARALAIEVENACASAWRFLYATAAAVPATAASAGLRRSAQGALTASAVRAARWRRIDTPSHATAPLPGLA